LRGGAFIGVLSFRGLAIRGSGTGMPGPRAQLGMDRAVSGREKVQTSIRQHQEIALSVTRLSRSRTQRRNYRDLLGKAGSLPRVPCRDLVDWNKLPPNKIAFQSKTHRQDTQECFFCSATEAATTTTY